MMQCGADCGAAPVSPYFTEFVEGRRGEILDAALAVFAIKGYECGTMREIAAELGVTEPALYRHYAGKEALFEDLVAVAGDRVVERASAVIDGLDPARVRDSLLELIRTRRGHGQGDAGTKPVMRMLFTAAPHNEAFREVVRAHLAGPMLERLRSFIPRVDAYHGIERTPRETTASLRIFMSLLVGYVMTGMMLDVPDDDDGVVDAIIAIMGWDAPAG
jgi:AcrR family transcriptional regulator